MTEQKLSDVYHRNVMADERTEIIERNGEDARELTPSNSYVTKKTVAQGMLDIALLMANTSQLKALFKVPTELLTGFHYALFVFVFLSLILQVAVGILICVLGFSRMRTIKARQQAEIMNNSIVILVLIITIINILINAFDIKLMDSP